MMISHNENHIKQMRMDAELTVSQLAELAGISKTTVYAIEENRTVPGAKTAYKLSVIFKCSIDEILIPFFHKEDNPNDKD